jgi:hypothetical protein
MLFPLFLLIPPITVVHTKVLDTNASVYAPDRLNQGQILDQGRTLTFDNPFYLRRIRNLIKYLASAPSN